ncbi:MAG: hypothetical protein K8R77_02805 [Anaerolineaceae bacterium]|nr:hypothetical protein [Anaerolineaceae bacterium]
MSEERIENEMASEVMPSGGIENKTSQEKVQIVDDVVDVVRGSVGSIQAQQVDLHQSAVQTINTGKADVCFGAMAQSTSQDLEVSYGALGLVKTGDAQVKASAIGGIVADDGVNMELSRSQGIFSRGNVIMDKSVAGLVGARKVKAENSNIVFLVAGKVEGDVQPMFGPRESLIFGAMAGIVGGILVLTGHLFKSLTKVAERKHKKDGENA